MKIRKPPRRIQLRNGLAAPSSASDQSQSIAASHAKQVYDLPREQRDVVCRALREGVKPAQIAYYFGDQGWISVSEKSFTQYIQAFRRLYPELVARDEDDKHLDHYVEPRQPHLDEEDTLEQLIRMSKIRLGIGIKFEKETGLLNKEFHKDINSTITMVETLAKMRGRMIGAGRPSNESQHQMPNEAKEQLRQNDQSEVAQGRVASLFERMGDLLAARGKQDATAETK